MTRVLMPTVPIMPWAIRYLLEIHGVTSGRCVSLNGRMTHTRAIPRVPLPPMCVHLHLDGKRGRGNVAQSGGATVKCLTIKQLNSSLPVSLSGKWIQDAAWTIFIIGNEHGHLWCLPSEKGTSRSVVRPSEGPICASKRNKAKRHR